MKILRFFALAVIIASALIGCRKELPVTIDPRDHIISTWSDAFEAYWDGMNYNYSFWDVDPTDWDKVYAEYKPLFEDLKLNVANDDTMAIRLLTTLSEKLIDHHMSITINTATTSYAFSPSAFELSTRDYYHTTYDKRLLYSAAKLNQIAGRVTNLEYGEQPTSEPNQQMEILSYLIDDNIAYMTFNHFAFSYVFNTQPNGPAKKAYNNFLEIIRNTPGLKGIILDVRQNGGGNTNDMQYVMGPLLREKMCYGYSHTKNGLGRLDYSPWTPWITQPTGTIGKPINVPIIVLIDLYSASMSEMTAMVAKTLPNGLVMGERSTGAHGPILSPYKFSYAGSFDTDIIQVYTSSHRGIDRDGNCYEGIGITPDIETLLNMNDMTNGIDNQLERTVEYIHTTK